MDESGLLSAYECSGPVLYFNVKAEIASEYVFSQKAEFTGLPYYYVKSFDCKRIFRPDVYYSFSCSYGVSPYGHGLEHAVGISLEYAPVHEGPGVALVCVAQYIFLVALYSLCEFPFEACRETASSAAPETGYLNSGYQFVPGHFSQNLAQGHVSFVCNVLLYLLGVNKPAVPQGYAELFLVKAHFSAFFDLLIVRGICEKEPADPAPLDHMLFDYLPDIPGRYTNIKNIVRMNLYNGALLAKAKASRLHHLDLLVILVLGKNLSESLDYHIAFRSSAARPAAYKDVHSILCHFYPPYARSKVSLTIESCSSWFSIKCFFTIIRPFTSSTWP